MIKNVANSKESYKKPSFSLREVGDIVDLDHRMKMNGFKEDKMYESIPYLTKNYVKYGIQIW